MKTTPKKSGKKPTKVVEITQEENDWINCKPRVVKGLKEVIKQQDLFIDQCKLTSMFLKIYEGNPSQFMLLIGDDVKTEYQFDMGLKNPDWMWESIDEMCADMVNGDKNFKIEGNGLFTVILFGSRAKKKTYKEIEESFKTYTGGDWAI